MTTKWNLPSFFVGLLGSITFVVSLFLAPDKALAKNNSTGKPNIIFILADDLGYGDLGSYGQKEIQTPHLDRMAAEGMRFTDCYAGSTVCAPSRCCLMTGLHTGHARVRANGTLPLLPEDVTVAEILKQAGYKTGLIGKWGLGEDGSTGIPNKQGFDEFFGYLNQVRAHNYYPEYMWRNQQKYNSATYEEKNGVVTRKAEYSHDTFTREALNFIEQNKNGPFFLYLAYTIPHANNEVRTRPLMGMEVPSIAPYENKKWPGPQKGHAAMITRMDRDIAKLFERLKKLGIDENTIVFFSSDNGPHKEGGADPSFFKSAGPLRGYKRSLHDGGIRVPFIVRWPGKIKAGTVSHHISAFWDFLPTAAELAGAESPKNIDGISMVPELLGKKQPKHEYLYWEFWHAHPAQALRMGKWKAIRPKKDAPIMLFNMENDIHEDKNIAGQHPEIVTKVKDLFIKARTPSADWPTPLDNPKALKDKTAKKKT